MTEDTIEFISKNPEMLLMLTDSYKFGHHGMYLKGTENIYSYFESRKYAAYPETVFFGLQFYLKKYLQGVVVTQEMIDAADDFTKEHFLGNGKFDRKMWEHMLHHHGGKLPLRIKAVPEGTPVNVSNVLMTVEITDETLQEDGTPLYAPLTNRLESLLTHVWASSNVATISREIKLVFKEAFKESVDEENYWLMDYMLHDFGFRGVSSVQSAGMGAAGHLINFKGTDTVVGITYAMAYYGAKMAGYSVNATEHSVATQLGPEGEFDVLCELIKNYPDGILSVVSDSYDIENAVKQYCTTYKQDILNRSEGSKFVVRPDSPRYEGEPPHEQILWILDQLGEGFGYTVNKKGFKVLNPKVSIIYGDGLSVGEIIDCIWALVENKWAASSCLYGMGGGLLQKHNRDTQRSAFKCSARKVDGEWQDVYKKPKDLSKASKAGRLALVLDSVQDDGRVKYKTVREGEDNGHDLLRLVFENGEVFEITWEEVLKNASVFAEPSTPSSHFDPELIIELSRSVEEKVADMKAILASEVKAQLVPMFQYLLNLHPKVKHISWTQYTPYFNDGNECYFSVYNDCWHLTNDDNYLYNENVSKSDKEAVMATYKEISRVLKGIPNSTWETLFGDHIKISVSLNENGEVLIKETYYNHD